MKPYKEGPMKMTTLFVVLSMVLFGCRDNFIELCADEYNLISAVVIESSCFDDDGASPVPVGDDTNMDTYKLRVHIVNERGMNLLRNVEWRVSDPTLMNLSVVEADPDFHRETSALIETLADILDRDGEHEPEATVVVCATNDCADYLGGDGCAPCVPEVCSAPHTVRAIINAEGDWRLSGATFPFPVPIRVRQTGRKLEAAFYEPEINGRQINFSSGNTSYVGHFEDETHVTGEAIVSPSGDNLGVWTAVKCPPTGCD